MWFSLGCRWSRHRLERSLIDVERAVTHVVQDLLRLVRVGRRTELGWTVRPYRGDRVGVEGGKACRRIEPPFQDGPFSFGTTGDLVAEHGRLVMRPQRLEDRAASACSPPHRVKVHSTCTSA